jgi:hypothetical protein
MKLFASGLALLGLTLAVMAQEKGVTYSSKDPGCQAWFPSKPTEKDAANGKQVLLEVRGGKAVYMLQFSKFADKKAAIDDKEFVDDLFKKTKAAVIGSFKGSKVLTEKRLTFAKKYPALDLDVDALELGIYRTRQILTPTHIYQVILLGPKDFVDAPEGRKFMDSFQLKN